MKYKSCVVATVSFKGQSRRGPGRHDCSLRIERLTVPFEEAHVCVCVQVSGLSVWIGRQLEPMSGLPPWAVTLLACLLVSAVTEFASNPATLTVFLPILSALVRHAHSLTHLQLAGRGEGKKKLSKTSDLFR